MRVRSKQAIERFLVLAGLPAAGRYLRRKQAVILAYHNVVADAASGGDVSLHLPRESFARQLDSLRRTHRVVPLRDLLAEDGGVGPRAAITFDDAYAGAVTLGVQEVVRRGLPATLFVAPALLGGKAFWWDVVASPEVPGLPASLRARALHEWRGVDARIREEASREGLAVADAAVVAARRSASLAQVRAAAARPGITVGSHTWSHPNLNALTESEIREELERSLGWLSDGFESAIPWLSYPYGLESPPVREAARAVGYEAAVRVEGGWMRRRPIDRHALPRLNIPAGLSPDGFHLRAAGLFYH
ncbi:MAG: polysaccharide deacetylase family protein [Gemmatimonadota bacterium]